MKTLILNQKNSVSGQPTAILNSITIDADKLLSAKSTKSVNTCRIVALIRHSEIDLQFNLFERVKFFAEKNNLIIN